MLRPWGEAKAGDLKTMVGGIYLLPVLVAAALLELVGYLWYGLIFKTPWAAAMGAAPHGHLSGALSQTLSVTNTVIVMLGLSWLLRRIGASGVKATVTAALAAWFFFDFTTMAVDFLFAGVPGVVVWINMGYQLAAYVLAGLIFGILPQPPEGQAA
jgi:hypothetical protein